MGSTGESYDKSKKNNLLALKRKLDKLELLNEVKYLGMILDTKLNWNRYVKHMSNKNKRIFMPQRERR